MSAQNEFYLWYNPQDKYYYERLRDTYSGICVSGHLAAHYKNAISALLNNTNKPYFIDPETVAFQTFDLNLFFNENGNLRISWKKMLDYYPSFIKNIINARRLLTISDFIRYDGGFEPILYELVLSSIEYQQRIIENTISDLSAFFDSNIELKFIIAPYFYFNTINDDWYRINNEILNYYNGIETRKTKYAVLCFNKNILLEENNVNRIISDLIKNNVRGYLLWIDNFDETNEQAIYFDNLLKLIKGISSLGKQIINLYGSYFSILSTYWGMSGHASGVNSKDTRLINERIIGGGPQGGPIPRYYIPSLHSRVVIDQGIRIIRQFPELQCSCMVCQNNPQGYDITTERSEGRRIMNEHFLYIKNEEINAISNTSYVDVFSNIQNSFNLYRSYRDILPINHLENWWIAIERNIHLI